jgi:hypothetical protein
MTTFSSAFDDVSVSSEHYSVQRFMAGMFPDIEIRRRFVEGVFLERPFMLITMVNHSVPSHNSYVAFPITDLVVAYYAKDFEDAQNALDKLSSLTWKNNRIPVWDYSDPQSPVATDYRLRVQESTCQLILDADDTELYNVICNLTVEGKRSYGPKYQGTVVESFQIGV